MRCQRTTVDLDDPEPGALLSRELHHQATQLASLLPRIEQAALRTAAFDELAKTLGGVEESDGQNGQNHSLRQFAFARGPSLSGACGAMHPHSAWVILLWLRAMSRAELGVHPLEPLVGLAALARRVDEEIARALEHGHSTQPLAAFMVLRDLGVWLACVGSRSLLQAAAAGGSPGVRMLEGCGPLFHLLDQVGRDREGLGRPMASGTAADNDESTVGLVQDVVFESIGSVEIAWRRSSGREKAVRLPLMIHMSRRTSV